MKPGKIDLTGRMNRRNVAGEDPVANSNYGASRLGISRADVPDIQPSDMIPAGDPFDLPPAPASSGVNQAKTSDYASPESIAAASRQEANTPTLTTTLRPFTFDDDVSQGIVPQAAKQDDIFSEPEFEYQEPTPSQSQSLLQNKRLLTAGVGIVLLSAIYVAIRIFSPSPSPATATPVADVPLAVTPANAGTASPTGAAKRAPKNRFAPPARPIVKDTLMSLVSSTDIECRVRLQEGRQLAKVFGQAIAAVPSWVRVPAGVDKPAVSAMTQPVPVKKFRECPPGLQLSGIISMSAGKYATVNDRMVKIGDSVNGANVVAITAFSVEMELDGENFVLGIGQGGSVAPAEDESTDGDLPAEKAKSADKSSPSTQPQKDKIPAKSSTKSTDRPATR